MGMEVGSGKDAAGALEDADVGQVVGREDYMALHKMQRAWEGGLVGDELVVVGFGLVGLQ